MKQEDLSNVFSEESKHKLKEVGNIELYELSETVRTTQCTICRRLVNGQGAKVLSGSTQGICPFTSWTLKVSDNRNSKVIREIMRKEKK